MPDDGGHVSHERPNARLEAWGTGEHAIFSKERRARAYFILHSISCKTSLTATSLRTTAAGSGALVQERTHSHTSVSSTHTTRVRRYHSIFSSPGTLFRSDYSLKGRSRRELHQALYPGAPQNQRKRYVLSRACHSFDSQRGGSFQRHSPSIGGRLFCPWVSEAYSRA